MGPDLGSGLGSIRTYAIGDIHGHLDKLRVVHGWIAADKQQFSGEVQVVHIGDLVDRGPDSAGVVGWLMAGIAAGEPWQVLKGNHDRMMTLFLEDPPHPDPCLRADLTWLDPRLGGLTTLASYGVDIGGGSGTDLALFHSEARDKVPVEHRQFLSDLPCIHCSDGTAYVHAGVRPGVPLDQQSEDDLIWIRASFHTDRRHHGALIVHGHTAVKHVRHHGNRINIDTGAGYGGALSAIVIERGMVWELGADGRQPLYPDV